MEFQSTHTSAVTFIEYALWIYGAYLFCKLLEKFETLIPHHLCILVYVVLTEKSHVNFGTYPSYQVGWRRYHSTDISNFAISNCENCSSQYLCFTVRGLKTSHWLYKIVNAVSLTLVEKCLVSFFFFKFSF